MTIHFLKLNRDDCQAAFAIQQQCHAFPWSFDVFASSLDGQYFAYQMQQDQQVIGYYLGLSVLDEATLMDIGLAPAFRGKGLGKTLLTHFIQRCKSHKMAEVWLEVRQSNISAIALYKGAGFTLIEQRKAYYPTAQGREDALIMKLILTD